MYKNQKNIGFLIFILAFSFIFSACDNNDSRKSEQDPLSNEVDETIADDPDYSRQDQLSTSNEEEIEDAQEEKKQALLKTDKNELFDAIETAKEASKKVNLKLMKEEDGDEITIKVIVENPQKSSVNSIRSFISYNPEVIRAKEIEVLENHPFTLAAPGEKDFDHEMGIVKLGLSTTGNPSSEKLIELALVKFERLKNETVSLDFFDVQSEGHTRVLSIIDNQSKDILNPPKTPALIF